MSLEQERLRLAGVVRAEMGCLLVRVRSGVLALDRMEDKDIADAAGYWLPKSGPRTVSGWLKGPLDVIRDAKVALAALNRVRVRELERERDLDAFGKGISDS